MDYFKSNRFYLTIIASSMMIGATLGVIGGIHLAIWRGW